MPPPPTGLRRGASTRPQERTPFAWGRTQGGPRRHLYAIYILPISVNPAPRFAQTTVHGRVCGRVGCGGRGCECVPVRARARASTYQDLCVWVRARHWRTLLVHKRRAFAIAGPVWYAYQPGLFWPAWLRDEHWPVGFACWGGGAWPAPRLLVAPSSARACFAALPFHLHGGRPQRGGVAHGRLWRGQPRALVFTAAGFKRPPARQLPRRWPCHCCGIGAPAAVLVPRLFQPAGCCADPSTHQRNCISHASASIAEPGCV